MHRFNRRVGFEPKIYHSRPPEPVLFSRPTPNTGQCRVTSCAVRCCMTSDLTCSHECLTFTPSTHTCASIFCTPGNAWSGPSMSYGLLRQSGRRFKGTLCLYFRGGSISLRCWGYGRCSSETQVLPTRLHGIIKPQQANESSLPNLRSNMGPVHNW